MKKTTLLLVPILARHACLWAALGLYAALSFGPLPARAAVTEAWVHRYNNVMGNSIDQAVKVVRDAAGDTIVTGTTDDRMTGQVMLTIKYSGTDGSVLWQKRYTNGSAQALAVDGSGNVLVTGYSDDSHYTAKYAAADGALLWEKRYYEGQAAAVAVDGGGNVVVTGSTYAYRGFQATNAEKHQYNRDYYTAKYASADGALLWEKRYNSPVNHDDRAQAVAVDGGNNVVVTGYSDGDYYTAKYATTDGALIWEQRYPNGVATAVAVDGSGNVVMSGSSATVKYAADDGALLWEQRFNGGGQAVAVDSNGNAVVSGSSLGTNYYSDFYTAKYAAADGALLWEQRSTNGGASAVAVDGSSDIVVTGTSGQWPNQDYYTAKYATADGVLLWEQRYNGPASGYDQARAVAVDGSGNVVVTGTSEDRFDPDGYRSLASYTAKYAASNGALLWEKRYNGPAWYDQSQAVAVDASGNVVVTGYSDLEGTYTAKYAAADGAPLWEHHSNGGGQAVAVDGSGNLVVTGWGTTKYLANGAGVWTNDIVYATALAVDGGGDVVATRPYATNSYPVCYAAKYAAVDGALLWEKRYTTNGNASSVAVDGSGNVVVTGYSGSHPNYEYYTVKYAAADGALLWEKSYNGPANSGDGAQAVTVDGSGNVVVTGYSYGGASSADYYTAKYAAVDGSLLWEKRYNGPASGYDFAQAVAVDRGGNVLVTGYSSNGTNDDYYTAKYAAADGALLWEKRYNGPANGDDRVAGLALGPNGMVAVTGTSSGDYATVVYRDDVYPISIALVPAGVRLRFTVIPGRSYTIERAPAVTGPWTSINTQTAPASGLLEYLDAPPPPGQAYYRTVQP